MKTWMIALIGAGILGMPLGINAQKFNPTVDAPQDAIKREKIEAFRIAFYTEKLNLTPKEAQEFWPVYNVYKKTMEQKAHESRSHHGEIPDVSKMSDQEAMAMVDNAIKQVQEISALTQKFYTDLKQILPPQKILIFFETDRSFKRVLLKRLEEYRSR
ncbi:MAG: hypothetical protein V1733_02735 [bacterium]